MKISDLDQPRVGDIVEFETDPETVVEGLIVGETDDGYIYEFSDSGYTVLDESHGNSKIYDKCWDGYKKVPGKKRGEKGSCVEESSGYIPRNSREARDPRWSSALTGDVTTGTMRDQIGKFFPTDAPADGQEQVTEAQYQGREVPLGRPMRGDVKKFKVYVKDPGTGNVKKVNFGDPNMRIKKSNPARRKSFRARHNCKSPGPRTKARYWSCRKW
jgi:hypothetical protein